MEIEYKIRTEISTVDVEIKESRRVLGSLTLDFISDEIVCIKGMRGGGGILKHMDSRFIKVLSKEFSSLKVIWFFMQPELFAILDKLNDVEMNAIKNTFVSGKKALVVEVKI